MLQKEWIFIELICFVFPVATLGPLFGGRVHELWSLLRESPQVQSPRSHSLWYEKAVILPRKRTGIPWVSLFKYLTCLLEVKVSLSKHLGLLIVKRDQDTLSKLIQISDLFIRSWSKFIEAIRFTVDSEKGQDTLSKLIQISDLFIRSWSKFIETSRIVHSEKGPGYPE